MQPPFDPRLWRRVSELFEELVELGATPRALRLREVAAAEPPVAAALARLLAADGEPGLLDAPVVLPAAPADEPTEAPPDRIGPWRLEDEIGRGGMGSVFRGRRDDGTFEQTVAVKLVRPELASDLLRRRFVAERRILAGLVHPNIAQLIDGGATAGGIPFLVLEYVEGEQIDSYCARRSLSAEERLRLFVVVCGAVAFAHRKLVLHRDLKPANVLVDETGRPKLLDFGIAKLLTPSPEDEDLTALGLAGPLTPRWASPEQLRGDALTTASDVYSLGLLLHLLLTGERAHVGGQGEQAQVRGLRGDLERIVTRAVAPEIAHRYSSVAELAADVERYLGGLPVLAHPPSLRYRLGKLVRRHRATAAASAVAILALLAGVLATAREAHRARRGEERARARFGDVRRLANAALFDLHDAIREESGLLSARRALARHALDYLTVLAEEAKEDPTLGLELATAYRKVGDVQGGNFLPSGGDTTGALVYYRKAAELLDELIPQAGDDPRRISLLADELVAVSDGFQSTRDFERATALVRRSIAMRQQLAPSVLRSEAERLRLGTAHVRLGRALREVGRFEEALVATREGVRLLEPLVEGPRALPGARRQLAKAYNQLGTLRGDPRQGLDAQEKALGIQTALSAAEPRNAQLQREVAWTLGDMAFPLSELGDTERIESNMERSASIFERLLAQDPANASDAHNLANAEIGLGWMRAQRGDFPAALDSLTRALRLVEGMLATDRGSVPARDLLWRIYRELGETTLKAAAKAPASAAARGGLPAACDWFSRSRKVLVELARPNGDAAYAQDLPGLTEKVSRCEQGEAPPLVDTQ